MPCRFVLVGSVLIVLTLGCAVMGAEKAAAGPARYCRFLAGNVPLHGLVEGDRVRQIEGDLFGLRRPTGKTFALTEVTLMPPTRPSKVLALAGNYDDLLLTTRVNGEVRQQQRTKDLVHNVAAIVSFASMHVTLEPGDLIYTGTPGKTQEIKPGDVVEVELEGVGKLANPVRARGEVTGVTTDNTP
jgi:translation initiation factor IF-1